MDEQEQQVLKKSRTTITVDTPLYHRAKAFLGKGSFSAFVEVALEKHLAECQGAQSTEAE